MRHALALLLAASPAFSAGLRLSGPKAEDRLRRFVASDKALRARLDAAKERESRLRAEARETPLRDAVAAPPAGPAQVIAQMPGMRLPPAPSCPTLDGCGRPEWSAAVEEPALLPDAVRGLLRPWLLVQEARGRKTEIASAAGEGDALLTVRLKGLDAAPFTLNVSPRATGGFQVWFEEPSRLSMIYERERAAALSAK